MPRINENQLRSNIKSGIFSNLYFIFGKEPLLAQYYANQIAKKAIDPQLADFNLTKLNGEDHTADMAADSAMNMPMLSDKRCVLLCDYDIVNLPKSDKDKLMDLITNPYPQTIVVFWFSGVELYQRNLDKSITNNIKGEWKKIIDEAEKSGCVLEITSGTEHDIKKRIYDNAVRRGRKIDRDAIDKLYDLVGNDTLLLSNELDKLAAFCDDGVITSSAVKELASKTVENNIFRIVDAINKQNGDLAYREVSNLLTANIAPELIIGTMSSPYLNAYYVSILKQIGKSRGEIIKILKTTDYQVKKAENLSYKLSKNMLEEILDAFLIADDTIKVRSNLSNKTILETLVAKLLLIVAKS